MEKRVDIIVCMAVGAMASIFTGGLAIPVAIIACYFYLRAVKKKEPNE
jgi:hypothetical protein